MKPLKNTSLYSRLTLITSVTLVIGYFVVYAAWTNLSLLEVESGDTITASLMQNIVNKINDIGARTDGIYSSAGNVGIGTVSPTHKLEVTGGAKFGGIDGDVVRIVGTGEGQGLQLSSSASNYKEIQSYETEPLYINRQGNNIILNATSGKVGIATTTPGDTLTVNGGVTANTFTSPVAWSPVTVNGAGWTANSVVCRRIGSFLQIKGGYFSLNTCNAIPAWGATVATLPVECRPVSNINYPVGSCWSNLLTSSACFTQINADGTILIYNSNSTCNLSVTGTYPAN